MTYVQFSHSLVRSPYSEDKLNWPVWRFIASVVGDAHLVIRSRCDAPWVEEEGTLRVHHVPGAWGTLGYLREARRIGERLAPDALLFDSSDPVLDAVVPTRLARRHGKRLSTHLQAQLFNLPDTYPLWKREVTKRAAAHHCKRADLVRAINRTVADEAVACGVPEGKIRVVPSRVDVERFRPHPDPARLRDELRLPKGPLVGYVGRLHMDKGVPDLIEAFARVRAVADARLLVVGDGPERDRVHARVRELGLQEFVLFTGAVPHDQVPRYMAAADVLTVPSHDEGMPRVILEAMACGRALVATRVGGIPELVRPGVTGWLAPPRDPPRLAEALLAALKDPDASAAVGRRAREIAVEEYRWEKGLAAYRAYLLEALGR